MTGLGSKGRNERQHASGGVKEIDAAEALQRLHNLQECILEEMRLLEYQSVVSPVFDYIWDGEDIRPDLGQPLPVELRFHLVQRIEIINGLNPSMLEHPERMNWGMNEISLIEVSPGTPLGRPTLTGNPVMHRASILWESDRRIDIDFAWVEILGPGSAAGVRRP